MINAGISGDTSAGGLSRLDLALEGDVRILVVALGANDGLRGLPVAQLRSNLARIIERAQARRITVVLVGDGGADQLGRRLHDGVSRGVSLAGARNTKWRSCRSCSKGSWGSST